MREVVAILASDIHLQAKAPVARSAEPDWFAAMARPLLELQGLADKHDAPVLYAGDIFDRWNAPPEVINFAMEHLPHGYAIPGQHDLPNHVYDDIERSAYWTLVKAGVLKNVAPGKMYAAADGLEVHGYPWGFDVKPLEGACDDGELDVALIHEYVCTKTTAYPGAPATSRVSAHKKALRGYDVAVYGDNHKGFIEPGPTVICNCGGFMRRKTDERKAKPGVGLLHADGTVTRHFLNVSEDKFIELTAAEEAVERVLDMTAFVDGLRGLGANDALDFTHAIKRFVRDNDVSEEVESVILQATEEA